MEETIKEKLVAEFGESVDVTAMVAQLLSEVRYHGWVQTIVCTGVGILFIIFINNFIKHVNKSKSEEVEGEDEEEDDEDISGSEAFIFLTLLITIIVSFIGAYYGILKIVSPLEHILG